jgi:hypothetical protein
MDRYVVAVLQSTLSVYVRGISNPFNRWSNAAYAQGFSWRLHSVSFLVPEDGDIPVTIGLEETYVLRPDATRAIRVPFEVAGGDGVEVSGIYEREDRKYEIADGQYSLYFECGFIQSSDGETMDSPAWCALTFVRGTQDPVILKRDEELDPPDQLVMDGEPA